MDLASCPSVVLSQIGAPPFVVQLIMAQSRRMPKPRSKKLDAKDASVINQFFPPELLHGLDVMAWFYTLEQFANSDKTTEEETKRVGRNRVLAMALQQFAKRYRSKTPQYIPLKPKRLRQNTTMRVPMDDYVSAQVIAERDYKEFTDAVCTAIHEFLEDYLTPGMRRFHKRVIKHGLALMAKPKTPADS